MRLLVLGGTVFVGRHIVETALSSGHDITIFNRGKTACDLFPGAEQLTGDRVGGNLSALEGRSWDAVIDTSGYFPRVVRSSARLLAGSVDHYTFVSSVSVYADISVNGLDENAPVGETDRPDVEDIAGGAYGPLKALCEKAVEAEMPGRVLCVRPGLIVGPCDATDSFTYWVRRFAAGGDVLCPGDPDRPVQIVDARDLACWVVSMVERKAVGTFNATGRAGEISMGRLVSTCQEVAGVDSNPVWVDDGFLSAAGVVPWTELPLWLSDDPATGGFCRIDSGRAVAAGLAFRPLADTVRDTLDWDRRRGDVALKNGLAAARESELLLTWRQTKTPPE